jgi:hypothetical protein
MSKIREKVVKEAINRSNSLIDYKIHNNIHKQCEFRIQTIFTDNSLTEDEKTEAIRKINRIYDKFKVDYNSGTKRICENCDKECFATLYCEYCIRYYLIKKFSNWTSGNYNIDNLIQVCQKNAISPESIVEWIPYNNLQDIKYLTKGGFSEIYTASWIGGGYSEWNSEEQQLERSDRNVKVILKKLENNEITTQDWCGKVCKMSINITFFNYLKIFKVLLNLCRHLNL